MPPRRPKAQPQRVATRVRDELESRRLFNEHYEVHMPFVDIKSGFGAGTPERGHCRCAKEHAESIARVVLDVRGQVLSNSSDPMLVITATHKAV